MNQICSQCKVCEFMPEQGGDRVLAFEILGKPDAPRPLVLLIDSELPSRFIGEPDAIVATAILEGVDYTFTRAVRCAYREGDITFLEEEEAISKCAVWTHYLLDERVVILTTTKGLKQMKVAKDYEPGDMFKSKQYGLVLVIPALTLMRPEEIPVYKAKAQRLLKEAKLL